MHEYYLLDYPYIERNDESKFLTIQWPLINITRFCDDEGTDATANMGPRYVLDSTLDVPAIGSFEA